MSKYLPLASITNKSVFGVFDFATYPGCLSMPGQLTHSYFLVIQIIHR